GGRSGWHVVLFRDVPGKMDELLGLGFRCSFPPLRTPFPTSCASRQNNLPFEMTVGGKSLHLGT
ncbi:mCG1028133, partial [Mus musculus]